MQEATHPGFKYRGPKVGAMAHVIAHVIAHLAHVIAHTLDGPTPAHPVLSSYDRGCSTLASHLFTYLLYPHPPLSPLPTHTPPSPPTPPHPTHTCTQMPRGAALLELRTLRALEKQAALRSAIEAQQAEIGDMQDKRYKNMLKLHRASRIDAARKDLAAKAELAAARVRDVKQYKQGGRGCA